MISIDALNSYTHKDLCQLAKQGGVAGWHAMRKDQLVRALTTVVREKSRVAKGTSLTNGHRKSTAAVRRAVAKPVLRSAAATVTARSAALVAARPNKSVEAAKSRLQQSKSIATLVLPTRTQGQPRQPTRDRIVVMVRDPYWLHVYWEVTSSTIERAQAALAQEWHLAKPVLRLMEVSDGVSTTPSEQIVSETEIHGGVSSWYLHVDANVKNYRVEIGYRTLGGRFHALARSNVVTTPAPSAAQSVDHHWNDVDENFDKIYALSGGYSLESNGSTELQEMLEERLRRPLGSPMVTRYGAGLDPLLAVQGKLRFELDAEIVVYGRTHPSAHVTLKGEPVQLQPDGSFVVRLPLPNQRQVIPAVACAANGALQRTIVIAVERNTKVMEPVVREPSE